jgi:hypothetical protein
MIALTLDSRNNTRGIYELLGITSNYLGGFSDASEQNL